MPEYLQSLYAVNELLLQKKKVYIWGYHEAASALFVKLCALSVKVEGFICDVYAGTVLWNRPVMTVKDVDDSDVVVCISDDSDLQEEDIEKYVLCKNPVILNPEFDKRQAVIYGAGKVGIQVLCFLQSINVKVLCFVDADEKKAGRRIWNIPVEPVSCLEKLPDTAYVIEAGYFYREMDETVTKYIGRKIRFYWEKPLEDTRLEIVRGLELFLPEVMGFRECFKDRKYYVYGSAQETKKSQDMLKLLGIEAQRVVDYADGATGKCIEDLLYEDNYLVLVAEIKKIREAVHKLELLGMREGREYVDIRSPYTFYSLSRTGTSDLNLSYTYLMDERYPGFKVHGDDRETDYKIVLLGGSTTDGGIGIYESWADYLYEKCKNYGVTILNGGISGYTSTQELLKLLRDVLKLHPDMVIVYDGVNDANNNYKGKPYHFKYLERTLSYGKMKESLSDAGIQCKDADYVDAEESFDIWLNNIEIMYAIARSRGIRFFGFLQPMLVSKKEEFLTVRERGYIGVCSLCYKRYLSDGREYRELMRKRKIADTHPYLSDLSDLFDKQDVYMDVCHVYEGGNRIIADKIWDTVKEYIVAH